MNIATSSTTQVQQVNINGNDIHYRATGSGPALLLIHGWPFHGASYDAMLPMLAQSYRCYVVDLPGMGQSSFHRETDFSFRGHAALLKTFCDQIIQTDFYCIAHDTGATVARYLAIADARMKKLVLLNTEIPGHRPPWIGFYRYLFRLPVVATSVKFLLQQNWYLRSSLGYGGCFHDPAQINEKFIAEFVAPQIRDPQRMRGIMRYLIGIDFADVDNLANVQRQIAIPVCLIWGEDDQTFPIAFARKMATEFATPARFLTVSKTKLLAYVERPEIVAGYSLDFLGQPA